MGATYVATTLSRLLGVCAVLVVLVACDGADRGAPATVTGDDTADTGAGASDGGSVDADGSGPGVEDANDDTDPGDVGPADTGKDDADANADGDSDSGFEPFPPGPPRLFETVGDAIRDSDGNVLHLRGVNISNAAKSAPDHLVDIDEDQLAVLRGSGIDMVRLLTFWKAVAPEEGTIDQGYLDAFAERVRALTGAGVLVVVDMHQDLWGAPLRSHGAPAWACPEEITEGYEPISPWWANYPSRQVAGCFDNFWASDELRTAFGEAWAALAETVCDEGGVLGFDLLNEPYPGVTHMSPTFDNDVLVPFYDDLMRAIEEACPGRLFFVEPSFVSAFGFTDPMQLPAHWRDRAVYAGHFYPAYVHEPDGAGYSGDRDALEALFDTQFGRQIDAGYPIWVGEFGGMTTHPAFGDYIADLEGIWAELGIHHAYWDWAVGDGGFAFRTPDGARKAVLDAVYTTPFPVRTPSPATLAPAFDERAIELGFTCRDGGTVEVALPAETCTCDDDGTTLVADDAEAGRYRAACVDSAEITLACACPTD